MSDKNINLKDLQLSKACPYSLVTWCIFAIINISTRTDNWIWILATFSNYGITGF